MASPSAIQQVSDTQGRPTWLVSGHERARELLADARLRRSHPNPGHPCNVPKPITRGVTGGFVTFL